MYKVFFNDHVLCFCDKNKISRKDNKGQVFELEQFIDFEKRFPNDCFMELTGNLNVVCSNPEKMWNSFRRKLTGISAAGGVLINSESKLLFIRRFGRWDLPKGKIEAGEHVEQAAIREVQEECGLSQVRIKRKLPSTFHLYFSPYITSGNHLVLKETSWFEMVYDGDEEPRPQSTEGISDVRWFSKDKLDEVYSSTYKNLLELLDNYLA